MQIFPLLEFSADYTEACIQLACGRLRRRASEETLSRISIRVISRFQYFYWKGISLARSQSFPFPSLCCHAYRLPSQCTVMAWAIQPAWILQSAEVEEDQQRFWLCLASLVLAKSLLRLLAKSLPRPSACGYNRVGAGGPLTAGSLSDFPDPHPAIV